MINNLLEDLDSEGRGAAGDGDAYHLIKSRFNFTIIKKKDNEILL
jgi:hypothetical protein